MTHASSSFCASPKSFIARHLAETAGTNLLNWVKYPEHLLILKLPDTGLLPEDAIACSLGFRKIWLPFWSASTNSDSLFLFLNSKLLIFIFSSLAFFIIMYSSSGFAFLAVAIFIEIAGLGEDCRIVVVLGRSEVLGFEIVWVVPEGLNFGPLPGKIPKTPPSLWALQITPITIKMNKSHIASLEFDVISTIICVC